VRGGLIRQGLNEKLCGIMHIMLHEMLQGKSTPNATKKAGLNPPKAHM
jgi:hypothetical protein